MCVSWRRTVTNVFNIILDNSTTLYGQNLQVMVIALFLFMILFCDQLWRSICGPVQPSREIAGCSSRSLLLHICMPYYVISALVRGDVVLRHRNIMCSL